MNRTGQSVTRPAIQAISTLCISVAVLAIGIADFAFAQAETTAADINSRVYQQLAGNPSAEKIQTVSGQMYIAKENIDSAVINDALAAMLAQGQGADAVVSVRSAPRLNFEIHFKKNSADLTPESREGLDALGEVLASEYLDTRFVLGGHTDLDGDAAMNGPLSQARADSARNYLLERHQITSDRLVAKGYGMSEPLREVEESAQDKLYNRRVDLRPVRGEAP